MPIAFVQAATQVNIAASSATALTITLSGVAAGNCLVLFGSIFDGNTTWTISSVTDGGDAFTTYQATAAATGSSGNRSRAVVSVAPNVAGGNVTVSVNLAGTSGAAGRYYVLGLCEFSGVALSAPEDVSATSSEINIGTTTDCSAGGTGFTTVATSLIVGTANPASTDTTMNLASPASWTNRYRQNDSFQFNGHDSGSWLPGAAQTNYTSQWAHDNTAGEFGAAVAVALKEAVSSAQQGLPAKFYQRKTFGALGLPAL